MVASQVVVARGLAPRNAQRRDHGPIVGLVLMRQEHAMAHVVEVPVVTRRLFWPRQ